MNGVKTAYFEVRVHFMKKCIFNKSIIVIFNIIIFLILLMICIMWYITHVTHTHTHTHMRARTHT